MDFIILGYIPYIPILLRVFFSLYVNFEFYQMLFLHLLRQIYWGFPHSSVCEESACNAEDPSLISKPGRSTGEGIGYPLWYSWASLVAQLVKNPPAMQLPSSWIRRSAGEGIGYPLQYSWASLMAQMVKNLPAVRESWV